MREKKSFWQTTIVFFIGDDLALTIQISLPNLPNSPTYKIKIKSVIFFLVHIHHLKMHQILQTRINLCNKSTYIRYDQLKSAYVKSIIVILLDKEIRFTMK
jgi:hypothetical protein